MNWFEVNSGCGWKWVSSERYGFTRNFTFFLLLTRGGVRSGIELKATNIKRQQLVTHALYGIKHSSDTDRLFVALFPLLLLLPFHSRSLSNEAHQREAKKWSIGPQSLFEEFSSSPRQWKFFSLSAAEFFWIKTIVKGIFSKSAWFSSLKDASFGRCVHCLQQLSGGIFLVRWELNLNYFCLLLLRLLWSKLRNW